MPKSLLVIACLIITTATPVLSETCLSPPRPFLPSGQAEMIEFYDIIRQDFEFYIADIQQYFRCLDAERARAFEEAREVSIEYGRLQEVTRNRSN